MPMKPPAPREGERLENWTSWNYQFMTNTWVTTGTTGATYSIADEAIVRDSAWYKWNHTYTTGDWITIPTYAMNTTVTTGANQIVARNLHPTRGADGFFRYVEVDDPAWKRWNTVMVETEEARLRRIAEEEVRRARMEEMMRVRQAEAAKTAAERAVANDRAKQLLMLTLDAQQKRDVLEHGWFEVVSDKGRRWRIRMDGIAGNVDLMPEEGNARIASYCAHPPGQDGLPNHDHHLAQKLALESDEEQFTNVAYLHYRVPGAALPDFRRTA